MRIALVGKITCTDTEGVHIARGRRYVGSVDIHQSTGRRSLCGCARNNLQYCPVAEASWCTTGSRDTFLNQEVGLIGRPISPLQADRRSGTVRRRDQVGRRSNDDARHGLGYAGRSRRSHHIRSLNAPGMCRTVDQAGIREGQSRAGSPAGRCGSHRIVGQTGTHDLVANRHTVTQNLIGHFVVGIVAPGQRYRIHVSTVCIDRC